MLSTTTVARRPSRRAPAKRVRLQRTSLDGWVQVDRGRSGLAGESPGPLGAIGVSARSEELDRGSLANLECETSLDSPSGTPPGHASEEGMVRKRKRPGWLERDLAALDAFAFRPGGPRARPLPHRGAIDSPRGSALPASPSGLRRRAPGGIASPPLFSALARYVEASSSFLPANLHSPRSARPSKRHRLSHTVDPSSASPYLRFNPRARRINFEPEFSNPRSETLTINSEDPTRANLNEVT